MLRYNDDSFDQSKTRRICGTVMLVHSEKIDSNKNSNLMKVYCVLGIKLNAETHHSIIPNEIQTWRIYPIRYNFKAKLML